MNVTQAPIYGISQNPFSWIGMMIGNEEMVDGDVITIK